MLLFAFPLHISLVLSNTSGLFFKKIYDSLCQCLKQLYTIYRAFFTLFTFFQCMHCYILRDSIDRDTNEHDHRIHGNRRVQRFIFNFLCYIIHNFILCVCKVLLNFKRGNIVFRFSLSYA